MINRLIIISIIIVLFTLHIKAQGTVSNPQQALTVTYVANEGFLIEGNGKKVLIDALFTNGVPDYLVPSTGMIDSILTGKGVFADIDLLLVTHSHLDHFNPELIIQYLLKHPRCVFLAHKQVVDSIRCNISYKDIQRQVHEFNLEPGVCGHDTVDGITIDALCLNHGRPQVEIKNLVFIADMGGIRFLHEGDSFFKEGENDIPLKNYPFEEAHINLLLLNQYDRWYKKTKKLIAERIKPAHIVVMHIGPAEFEKVSTAVYDAFPGAVIFEKPMEQKVFK